MGAPSETAEIRNSGEAGSPGRLGDLLPGGLRPGITVSAGMDLPLLLALGSEAASERPGWAAVGLPHMGVLAARHAGLDLASGVWVDAPGGRWPQVLGHLIGAVPVVLLDVPGPVPGRIRARIEAQLRASSSVLLVAGSWEGADLQFRVTGAVWEGLSAGHGVLRRRRVRVEAVGRGRAGGRPRWAEWWLPGPDGAVPAVPEAITSPTGAGAPAAAGLRVVG